MSRISCELGHNMATHRRRAGLTQTDLAAALAAATGAHITMTIVSNWERGHVDVPAAMLPAICQLIHCSSYDLYPHSVVMSDRDVQLVAIIKALSDADKDDLYYLLHEWRGDRKALLKLDVIHAVLPEHLRYAADQMIIDNYKYAIKHMPQDVDHSASTDLAYVLKAWHDLTRDEED